MAATDSKIKTSSAPVVPHSDEAGRPSVHALLGVSFLIIAALFGMFFDVIFVGVMAVLIPLGIWVLCLWYIIRSHRQGFLLPTTEYIALLGLFHLGMIVPIRLNLAQVPHYSRDWLASPNIPYALYMVCVAMLVFAAGVSMAMIMRQHKGKPAAHLVEGNRPLLYAGALFVIPSITVLLYKIFTLNLYMISYNETFSVFLEQDPRLFGTGFRLFTIGAVLMTVGSSAKRVGLTVALVVLLFSPLLFLGFRGPFMVLLLLMLSIWYQKSPQVARKWVIISLIAIFIMVPGLKAFRNARTAGFSNALTEVNLLSVPMETGYSLRPLVETVGILDTEHHQEFWYGNSYLMSVERVLPNLSIGWQRESKAAEQTPSHWISAIVTPMVAKAGGGIGFSGVAEPYLNFGTAGVVVYFMLLGFLTRRAETRTDWGPYVYALFVSVMAAILWTTRNDYMGVFRQISWAGVYIYFVYLLEKRYKMPKDL